MRDCDPGPEAPAVLSPLPSPCPARSPARVTSREQGSGPRLCSGVAGASRGCTHILTGASRWATRNPGVCDAPISVHTRLQGVLTDALKHSGEVRSLVQGHPALPLVKLKGALVRR